MTARVLFGNGAKQLILTPDSHEERVILDQFKGEHVVETYMAEFRECQGGYWRNFSDTRDVCFVFRKPQPEASS